MKKKILLLSDDLRMTSGVATMSKEIVLGTVHKYDWVQLSAAIKHPEYGKIIDLNDDVRETTGVEDANVKLYPNNGYGDIVKLREIIDIEKPDAILHFTDPHYWQWLYDNEHEIRQNIPIFYYHIWDDLPDPYYNKNFYESCDWLGCISKQTYGIVNRVGKMSNHSTQKSLEDWQITYVPHGINDNVYKPLSDIDPKIKSFICGEKEYDFILFYNNRNIKRKQPADVIFTYKLFCDSLPKEKSDKCLLLMHTNAVDSNGTDLIAVGEDLCPDYDIKFTSDKFSQEQLNQFYNLVDCTINISNNEGFGLTTAESLMAGTPVICTVTGGLQDQCGFSVNGKLLTEKDYITIGSLHDKRKHSETEHGEWVSPVWPSSITLNGSIGTPYIFDDRINHYDVVDSIKEVYKWGREGRKTKGLKGRDFMVKNFNRKVMCDSMIGGIDKAFKKFNKKKPFDLYKII